MADRHVCVFALKLRPNELGRFLQPHPLSHFFLLTTGGDKYQAWETINVSHVIAQQIDLVVVNDKRNDLVLLLQLFSCHKKFQ